MATIEALAGIAEDHDGVIPAAAARRAGIPAATLVKLANRGGLERVGRGVYRFPLFPQSRAPNAELYEALAFMAAGNGPKAVLSNETALQLRGVSDAMPAVIHLTIPPGVRLRRNVPKSYRLHRSTLAAEEIEYVEGLPTTTIQRTIKDVIIGGRRDLALAAIQDATSKGYLTRSEAAKLRRQAAD